MNKPRVSIIIPLYNASCTILETLDTVYRQDYNDWEVILFDDASTDKTPIIAR